MTGYIPKPPKSYPTPNADIEKIIATDNDKYVVDQGNTAVAKPVIGVLSKPTMKASLDSIGAAGGRGGDGGEISGSTGNAETGNATAQANAGNTQGGNADAEAKGGQARNENTTTGAGTGGSAYNNLTGGNGGSTTAIGGIVESGASQGGNITGGSNTVGNAKTGNVSVSATTGSARGGDAANAASTTGDSEGGDHRIGNAVFKSGDAVSGAGGNANSAITGRSKGGDATGSDNFGGGGGGGGALASGDVEMSSYQSDTGGIGAETGKAESLGGDSQKPTGGKIENPLVQATGGEGAISGAVTNGPSTGIVKSGLAQTVDVVHSGEADGGTIKLSGNLQANAGETGSAHHYAVTADPADGGDARMEAPVTGGEGYSGEAEAKATADGGYAKGGDASATSKGGYATANHDADASSLAYVYGDATGGEGGDGGKANAYVRQTVDPITVNPVVEMPMTQDNYSSIIDGNEYPDGWFAAPLSNGKIVVPDKYIASDDDSYKVSQGNAIGAAPELLFDVSPKMSADLLVRGGAGGRGGNGGTITGDAGDATTGSTSAASNSAGAVGGSASAAANGGSATNSGTETGDATGGNAKNVLTGGAGGDTYAKGGTVTSGDSKGGHDVTGGAGKVGNTESGLVQVDLTTGDAETGDAKNGNSTTGTSSGGDASIGGPQIDLALTSTGAGGDGGTVKSGDAIGGTASGSDKNIAIGAAGGFTTGGDVDITIHMEDKGGDSTKTADAKGDGADSGTAQGGNVTNPEFKAIGANAADTGYIDNDPQSGTATSADAQTHKPVTSGTATGGSIEKSGSAMADGAKSGNALHDTVTAESAVGGEARMKAPVTGGEAYSGEAKAEASGNGGWAKGGDGSGHSEGGWATANHYADATSKVDVHGDAFGGEGGEGGTGNLEFVQYVKPITVTPNLQMPISQYNDSAIYDGNEFQSALNEYGGGYGEDDGGEDEQENDTGSGGGSNGGGYGDDGYTVGGGNDGPVNHHGGGYGSGSGYGGGYGNPYGSGYGQSSYAKAPSVKEIIASDNDKYEVSQANAALAGPEIAITVSPSLDGKAYSIGGAGGRGGNGGTLEGASGHAQTGSASATASAGVATGGIANATSNGGAAGNSNTTTGDARGGAAYNELTGGDGGSTSASGATVTTGTSAGGAAHAGDNAVGNTKSGATNVTLETGGATSGDTGNGNSTTGNSQAGSNSLGSPKLATSPTRSGDAGDVGNVTTGSSIGGNAAGNDTFGGGGGAGGFLDDSDVEINAQMKDTGGNAAATGPATGTSGASGNAIGGDISSPQFHVTGGGSAASGRIDNDPVSGNALSGAAQTLDEVHSGKAVGGIIENSGNAQANGAGTADAIQKPILAKSADAGDATMYEEVTGGKGYSGDAKAKANADGGDAWGGDASGVSKGGWSTVNHYGTADSKATVTGDVTGGDAGKGGDSYLDFKQVVDPITVTPNIYMPIEQENVSNIVDGSEFKPGWFGLETSYGQTAFPKSFKASDDDSYKVGQANSIIASPEVLINVSPDLKAEVWSIGGEGGGGGDGGKISGSAGGAETGSAESHADAGNSGGGSANANASGTLAQNTGTGTGAGTGGDADNRQAGGDGGATEAAGGSVTTGNSLGGTAGASDQSVGDAVSGDVTVHLVSGDAESGDATNGDSRTGTSRGGTGSIDSPAVTAGGATTGNGGSVFTVTSGNSEGGHAQGHDENIAIGAGGGFAGDADVTLTIDQNDQGGASNLTGTAIGTAGKSAEAEAGDVTTPKFISDGGVAKATGGITNTPTSKDATSGLAQTKKPVTSADVEGGKIEDVGNSTANGGKTGYATHDEVTADTALGGDAKMQAPVLGAKGWSADAKAEASGQGGDAYGGTGQGKSLGGNATVEFDAQAVSHADVYGDAYGAEGGDGGDSTVDFVQYLTPINVTPDINMPFTQDNNSLIQDGFDFNDLPPAYDGYLLDQVSVS